VSESGARDPSRPAARLARAAWLTYWDAMRRYHRYEVVGLEHLDRTRPALIVGYHGRPIAHDLCMLTAFMHERTGAMPHAFIHGAFEHNGALRAVVDGVGFVSDDEASIRHAIERGEHLVVTPGGTREGCRSHSERYRVNWGSRRGYARLARKFGLPIIPSAASGIDDMYIGLNDGDAWSRRLKAPLRLPVWLGVGPVGLWPLSPPFPVKVVQHLGAPITSHLADGADARDEGANERLHAEVAGAVQRLLDIATGQTH